MGLKEMATARENLSNDINLSLNFRGLGLLHRGEANWRCWFPKVKDHELTLIIEDGNRNPITRLHIPKGSRIEIEVEIEDQIPMDESLANEILNVNRQELHNDGLKIRNDKNHEISRLKFSRDVHLFSDGKPEEYFIWKINPSGTVKEKTIPVTIKEEASAFIRCKTGSETKIKVRDGINADINLSHTETSRYMVIFDNHCDSMGCASSSDYYFYYELIDTPADFVKYELIQDPPADPSKAPAPMCDIVIGDRLDYEPWD